MFLDFYSGRHQLDREFEQARASANKRKDLIEELLSDLHETVPKPRIFDIDSYLQGRHETAKRQVDQIWKQIKNRSELRFEFVREIDTQIRYVQFSLDRFKGWGVGYNTGVDVKRNHLERQLQQLRTERRATELKTWDDLVKLKKELREALDKYDGTSRLQHVSQSARTA